MREEEERFQTKKPEEIKVISNGEIIDYSGIPSSTSLLMVDATPLADIRLFIEKRKERALQVWGKKA
jgi:hypothetical protein